MTTAPNTLMIITIEPSGKEGVTQPLIASVHSTETIFNSSKNEKPIIDTKAMIIFSILG